MICHQGSARASPRLRQALPAAKGLTPYTEECAFHPALVPLKATRDPGAPTPRGLCSLPAPGHPPGGHGHRQPLPREEPPRYDHPSVGYWENTEHSASTPPEAPGLGRRPRSRWEQSADVAGCPTSPGSRGTRLLPCFQSDSGAESPRRVRMPPGPSAAAAEPTGDGVFRRVFQTSS